LIVATGLTLFVFAFPVLLADLGPGPYFYLRLLIFPADLTLAVVLLAAIAVARAERSWPPPGTTLLCLLTASLAVALVFHPSPQGLLLVARFAGGCALAFTIARARRPVNARVSAVRSGAAERIPV